MIRDFFLDPDLDFLLIPDPGSRGLKGTGSATLFVTFVIFNRSNRAPDPFPRKEQDREFHQSDLDLDLTNTVANLFVDRPISTYFFRQIDIQPYRVGSRSGILDGIL
jgi:hypothetical protein